MTVIDDQRAAGEIEIRFGQADDARGGRMNRCARGYRNIDARMRLLRLTVENALAAEDAADAAFDGPFQGLRESVARGIAVAGHLDFFSLAPDARFHFGRWSDLLFGQTVDALDLPYAFLH